MRKVPPVFIVSFLFISISLFSFSQQTNKIVDSLLKEIEISKEDTTKVITLNTLSWQFIQMGRYSEAKNYAVQANSLAQTLDFKKGFANSYNNIGLAFYNQGNYSEALKNYFASLKIREEMGHKMGMAMVHNNIGLIYKDQGNYFDALKHLDLSLKLKTEIGDKALIASGHLNIGTIYCAQGKQAKAVESFFASLKIYEELGVKWGLNTCYIQIGTVYINEKNYKEALRYFVLSLKISEEIGDKQGIARAYNHIGIIYNRQENFSEALKNHLLALKVSEEIGEKREIFNSYINIGYTYEKLGNLTEALKNYETSLEISKEIGNKEGILVCYQNIGNIYTRLNNNVKSREFLNKALLLAKGIGDKGEMIDTYKNLSRLDSAERNYKQALANYKLYAEYKDSVLNEYNSKQIAQIREQYEAEKKDREILILTNDKLKLETQQQITALIIKSKHDSLNIVQSENQRVRLENEKIQAENLYKQQQIELLDYEKQLQQLQIGKDSVALAMQKTEADKKQEQLLVLRKEKDIQSLQLKKQKEAKNYFLGGVALLAILLFFIFRNFKNQQKLSKLYKVSAAKQMVELQLENLRAQLNPHFMFNSLNAIQELIVTDKTELSQSYLERFAKLLRMLLENANQPFILLRKEINFLELYLSLENLRIPDLKYSIQIAPEVNTETTVTPNLMLQPYIENALWHGLQHKQGEKKLQLNISRQNGSLTYKILDNGVGRKKAEELKGLYRKEHRSKGMELLSKRFSLLSKEYGKDIVTEVNDITENGSSVGTVVKISVPNSLTELNQQNS
jgi:tetratricopeptide (TPR) repeat protein